MCQHTDRKRRKNCIDSEALERNNPHVLCVVSDLPNIFEQTVKPLHRQKIRLHSFWLTKMIMIASLQTVC